MRLIIITGMGGAGVSTVAGWTAARCGAGGRRVRLLDASGGPPLPNASIPPVRVVPHAELARWPAIEAWLADLAGERDATALTAALAASSVADLLSLLAIARALSDDGGACVIVDAPPVAAAHRMLTLPALAARLGPLPRRAGGGRVARALARQLVDAPLPSSAALDELADWHQRLAALAAVLADPETSAVRVVLRGGPQATRSARELLAPLVLSGLPLDTIYSAFDEEDAGAPEEQLCEALHPLLVSPWPLGTASDPAQPGRSLPPLQLQHTGSATRLLLPLPLQSRAALTLRQQGSRIVISAGGATREVGLPDTVAGQQCTGATYDGATLTLAFEPAPVASS